MVEAMGFSYNIVVKTSESPFLNFRIFAVIAGIFHLKSPFKLSAA